MTERILVTGATGFVGAAVARAFADAGYRVRALVRDPARGQALREAGMDIVAGDLARPESLEPALDGCTCLAHVAADYRLFVPDPAPLYRVNVDGTKALLHAARNTGIERVVYTSSVATLGHRENGAPADETTEGRLEDMVGHYKRSKFLAEQAVREVTEDTDLHVTIVNPSAPVGPGDIKPTPTGRMVLDAARGRMLAWLDTGLNIVHVDDVGEGHRLALEHGKSGERYILGGENLALRDIFTTIAALAGRSPPRIKLAPGPLVPLARLAEGWAHLSRTTPLLTRDELAMARHVMYYDSRKAERELGYTHRPAEAAFRDALCWFAADGRLSPDTLAGYTAASSDESG